MRQHDITYFPFGAAASWTWGSGTVAGRSFDGDGRISALPLGPAGARQIVYDAGGRITGLNDAASPVNNQTYGYDALDRITNWNDSGSARAYTYDATGNRTSLAISGNTYLYTVAASSNRLTLTDGPPPARTFTYDGAGNITGDGQSSFTYNDRGRLVNANGATYVYDGLGQRVKKSGPSAIVPSGVNYYVYDEDGKLLGEYDASGAVISEYAYLEDQVVAVMRGASGTTEVFYVYTDQVGRPWVITDAMDQPRWRWDTSPFGEFAANDNPAGLGAFTFNVRFPGQYYDAESGLFYNYFRDYDPQTGRYVQSDPIGLGGGLNTYGYAESNPLTLADPLGLWALGDPLPQGMVDAASGFGDALSLGLTKLVREQGGFNDSVNECSVSYDAARYAGYIWGGTGVGLRAAAAFARTRLGNRLLNSNRYFRIGPGRMPANRPFPHATDAPRISVGSGPGNPHIDLRVRGLD